MSKVHIAIEIMNYQKQFALNHQSSQNHLSMETKWLQNLFYLKSDPIRVYIRICNLFRCSHNYGKKIIKQYNILV